MSFKKIYLIRHGQTDYNIKGIVQGSGVDSNLNEKGEIQGKMFFNAYKGVNFSKIYTSNLKRSVQSVQGFIDLGIAHERHDALNEINWGFREGTNITSEEDVYYHSLIRSWQEGSTHIRIEGGESPEDVAARQRPFIEDVLKKQEDENILICMHGRAMRILLCQLLNYPLQYMDTFEHQNLCLYLLHNTGSMFQVARYKDVDHLEEFEF